MSDLGVEPDVDHASAPRQLLTHSGLAGDLRSSDANSARRSLRRELMLHPQTMLLPERLDDSPPEHIKHPHHIKMRHMIRFNVAAILGGVIGY
jgi:hypothetical protein